MTLELFSNCLQLLVATVVAIRATLLALQKKTVVDTLIAGMMDTFALGTLYWFTYQFITDVTPQIFYIADISWIASYLFLLALELHLSPPAIKGKQCVAMYIPFPVGLALTVYFCQWGDILLNIAYMLPLSICGYLAIRNLYFGKKKTRFIHIFCIVFILTEYALWLASCFWISDTWTNPYFWFDFAVTAEIGLFLPLSRKAVGT